MVANILKFQMALNQQKLMIWTLENIKSKKIFLKIVSHYSWELVDSL